MTRHTTTPQTEMRVNLIKIGSFVQQSLHIFFIDPERSNYQDIHVRILKTSYRVFRCTDDGFSADIEACVD